MKCAAVLLLCVCGLLVSPVRAADPELDKLQGKWNVESYEFNGAAVPEMAGAVREFLGNKYTLTPKSGETFTGTIELNITTSPKQMDLQVADRTLKGIYEVDGETLRIAYTLEGGSRPKEFASKPGSGVALVVHKKAG
jgi:uncharacterized protein (TIGR03067 family)